MFDANLLLRAAAALTASETSATGVDFGGPDLAPMTYQAHIPSASGTSPTCDIKIQESDNNSTWRDFLVFQQITAAGEYFVTGKSDARYRRIYITLGGTSPNFGSAMIGPVPAGRHAEF